MLDNVSGTYSRAQLLCKVSAIVEPTTKVGSRHATQESGDCCQDGLNLAQFQSASFALHECPGKLDRVEIRGIRRQARNCRSATSNSVGDSCNVTGV